MVYNLYLLAQLYFPGVFVQYWFSAHGKDSSHSLISETKSHRAIIKSLPLKETNTYYIIFVSQFTGKTTLRRRKFFQDIQGQGRQFIVSDNCIHSLLFCTKHTSKQIYYQKLQIFASYGQTKLQRRERNMAIFHTSIKIIYCGYL